MQKVVLWDFDGTLAYRPKRWSGCLLEALDSLIPEHSVTTKHIQSLLQGRLPWHSPELTHTHLNTNDMWWDHMSLVFVDVFRTLELSDDLAQALSHYVRTNYMKPSRWNVFADSAEALASVSELGWSNVILSNHAPELSSLVEALPFSDHIKAVLSSASTGFEKPNVKAFEHAKAVTGNPQSLYMVGDNVEADIYGASIAGIRAIHILRDTSGIKDTNNAAKQLNAITVSSLMDIPQILASTQY